jgi:hypothetical protein
MAIFAATALVLLAAGSVAGLTAIEAASKGPAFAASARYLRDHPVVRRELGVVVGFGFTVSGSVVEGAGEGRALITFDVLGSWRTGQATMRVVKEDDRWRVLSGVLRVGGNEFQIARPPDRS